MSLLVRWLIVAMVLVVGVLGMAICAEGTGAECDHLCCGGADRSRPANHLVRKAMSARTSVARFARSAFTFESQAPDSLAASFIPAPALLRASSLRI